MKCKLQLNGMRIVGAATLCDKLIEARRHSVYIPNHSTASHSH